MKKEELFIKLTNKDKINNYIDLINNHDLIKYLFEIVESTNIEKYQAEKVIRELSFKNPQLLYPYFDRMVRLLKSDNNFIRYGFIISIPNLLQVDICNKWGLVKNTYIDYLNSTKVIEFCNTVKTIDKIIKFHRKEEDTIIPILIKIDKHLFLDKEEISKKCNDIAKSVIMDTLYKIYPISLHKEEILKFVKKNKNNKKSQIKNKANKFLKKYDKGD